MPAWSGGAPPHHLLADVHDRGRLPTTGRQIAAAQQRAVARLQEVVGWHPLRRPAWGEHPAQPHEQAQPTGPTAKAVARRRGRAESCIMACGRFRLTYTGTPLIMGILNVTPDSFSDGGRYLDPAAAIDRVERMVAEGAHLIDIGGESTRPGAQPVKADEEAHRVVPIIRALSTRVRVPISIDTAKAVVAEQALDAGASLVNDVTALRGDPRMASVVARADVPIILMHMRGTPRTMQHAPRYRDVVGEIHAFLREAVHRARTAGIATSRILLDPGLGFGKTVTHNLLVLRHLDQLVRLGHPVVIGPSRKSFLGRILESEIDDRGPGTLACLAEAAEQGVQIVRVHDVKPAVQFLTTWSAIRHPSRWRGRAARITTPPRRRSASMVELTDA